MYYEKYASVAYNNLFVHFVETNALNGTRYVWKNSLNRKMLFFFGNSVLREWETLYFITDVICLLPLFNCGIQSQVMAYILQSVQTHEIIPKLYNRKFSNFNKFHKPSITNCGKKTWWIIKKNVDFKI